MGLDSGIPHDAWYTTYIHTYIHRFIHTIGKIFMYGTIMVHFKFP